MAKREGRARMAVRSLSAQEWLASETVPAPENDYVDRY